MFLPVIQTGRCYLCESDGKFRVEREQSRQSRTKYCVVVDAGHGGSDPGMIGVSGLEEKGINLSISLLLRDTLEKSGYSVIMTREEDKGLYDSSAANKKAQDMQRRIAMIREHAPVLSVSIHQNSYQTSDVKGAQVFYFTHSVEGKKAAEILQKHLKTVDETNRREAKPNDTYYILKKTEIPTVIVEAGFLTNPEEAAKLQDEAYQEKIAQAVWEGLKEYLNL